MNELAEAVTLLAQGGLVAFPTETVYGLGADAGNETAVRKVFSAKGRPLDHPLIVHIASDQQLADWARDVPPIARQLAAAFWPGPLTLILKKQPHVLDVVTGGQDTVGIRIPSHPLALKLLSAFGRGVVAPSANLFTHVSPTLATDVYEELGDRVDLILDGGACTVGLESTIVDVSTGVPIILRPGMITAEMIAAVTGQAVTMKAAASETMRVPGQHHLHYAPTTKTLLVSTASMNEFLQAKSAETIAVMLYHDLSHTVSNNHYLVNMPKEAETYAQTLYHTLRALDRKQVTMIVIEEVPNALEWTAIRDRLTKATVRIAT